MALSRAISQPRWRVRIFSSRQPDSTFGERLRRCAWPGATVFLALAFGFVTGPFRAPDEAAHFFRAYEISEGHLLAQRVGLDLLGDYVPASLPKVMRMLDAYAHKPPLAAKRKALALAARVPLKRHTRAFAHFPGAALHSPLMYLPAALAIAIGRLLHGGPLLLFYLGRIANALVAGSLLGWALQRVWLDAPFLAVLALFPMCLSQVGTLTSDALTFAISFAWLAVVLNARRVDVARNFSTTTWLLFAAALSQVRFPYPLLGLLVFSVPRFGHAFRSRARALTSFLALLLAPCLGWIAIVQRLTVQMRPLVHVDPAAQLNFVLEHPLAFLSTIGRTLAQFGADYWHEAIGVLGWLEFPVPIWIFIGITLALLVAVCASNRDALRITPRFRLACFALGFGGLLLTALVAYLGWNRVGAPLIEGWQGRYALPLLPVLLLALSNGRLARFRWPARIAIAFSLLADAIVIALLARVSWLS